MARLLLTIGKLEPEIERILEYARQTLRERLIEAGCAVTTPTTDQVLVNASGA
jgi:hypothetical protein